MARSPCGHTAAVAANATVAVAFLERRVGAGNSEINDAGVDASMRPTILPQQTAPFR
jgi:hypothetical protein